MKRAERAGGFTVVELLVILVVVALISVMVIPILLNTLEVGKQKRTMSDINLVGKGLMSWVNDQVGAAAAGATTVPVQDYGAVLARDDIEALLVPQYLPNVPEFDAWGGGIEYRLNLANLSASRLIAIRSGGRDRVFSTDTYASGAFDPRAFNEDIVWVDGIFVRWPEKD